jgi:hypothetical protein
VDELEHSEQPALAKRVQIVDGYGESYGPTVVDAGVRRLPVDAAGISVSVSGITISGLSVDPNPGTPTITNVSYPTSGIEQSHVLPSDTQKFTIRVRGMNANMRLGFGSGDTSSGPYLTIRRGNSFFEDSVKTSATLYFQVDKSSQVVEILTWH